MRAISSFETSCTMRVLILTVAFLASATAAPSGAFFGPIVHNPYYTIPIPAAVPTISAGDLQAAAINAKVQFEQQAQAVADKARELAEQATEKQNEGIIEANDLAKERAEESFWAAEEQKWQALDALKTAEAQIDGSIASRASDVALAAYSVPTAIQAQTGLLGHSVVAAVTKSIPTETANVEEQKEKTEGEAMAAVKSVQAESKPENTEKSVENVQAGAAKMVSSASVKTAEAVKEENPAASFLGETHLAPVVSNAFLAQPWLKQVLTPISYISGLQPYVPNLIPQYKGQLVNPVLFRATW
ncbi:unnamed protein product [Parnassius apollo]|uniref:(apollo) hypothetical protein n=1 Tax=Parnassius apollo TaxID=110799 RepID=A0A8S3YAM6_PARAO|nr:unnamed protein product [Parnassius apollo]